MDLNDWAKKNLIDEMTVTFDKIKVIAQNKDGSLKLNADGHWVNKCSVNAIKAAQDKAALHIVYRKKEGWKNPAWITDFDWEIELAKEE